MRICWLTILFLNYSGHLIAIPPAIPSFQIQAQSINDKPDRHPRKFYIALQGDDDGPGTQLRPWKSINRLNSAILVPGDTVNFKDGETFEGTIKLTSTVAGSVGHWIIVGSEGKKPAQIQARNNPAILLTGNKYLKIQNLVLLGNGRKNGNRDRGIFAQHCSNIFLTDLEVMGFQKSGVEIMDCSAIRLTKLTAHDNGAAGISVTGNAFPAPSNFNIYIGHCKTFDNPGDPTELNNHSGNGIVAGLTRGLMIEYCVATNNGWDMPRKGNGPVGIWAWEADSVIIQHCISYKNRTSPGALDGGGFDLDGGVTNSIVQYNLSYENEGYGFGIFQFSGASPWHHNTFRYNISFNDGNRTQNGASVLWWNGSKDSSQFHDCYFYQNLLYNSKGHVLGVVPDQYDCSNFYFINNIFVAKDELMSGGNLKNEKFFGNDWWSISSGFSLNGNHRFKNWAQQTGQEKIQDTIVGSNIDPNIQDFSPSIIDPEKLSHMKRFQLPANSPLRNKGINPKMYFTLQTGNLDFFGKKVPMGLSSEPGISEIR